MSALCPKFEVHTTPTNPPPTTRYPQPGTLPSLPNRDASTMSGKSFVYIKRAEHSEDAFAKLPFMADDVIADIAQRACETFPRWQADASQVKLFLVSKERAKQISNGATFDHTTAETALFPSDTLDEARVTCFRFHIGLGKKPSNKGKVTHM